MPKIIRPMHQVVVNHVGAAGQCPHILDKVPKHSVVRHAIPAVEPSLVSVGTLGKCGAILKGLPNQTLWELIPAWITQRYRAAGKAATVNVSRAGEVILIIRTRYWPARSHSESKPIRVCTKTSGDRLISWPTRNRGEACRACFHCLDHALVQS